MLTVRVESCGSIMRMIDVASPSGDKMRNDIMFRSMPISIAK